MENFLSVRDFEKTAVKKLSTTAAGFYNSGATDEQTLIENHEAFKQWIFRPRVLRDVSDVDTSVRVLDEVISFPVCISPTSLSKMASRKGEIDVAKAAARFNTIYTLSSMATSSIEEVVSNVPDGIKWFQLYVFKDRKLTKRLVKRAERNSYTALVLTVDLPALGQRYADVRNKFTLPPNLTLKNFDGELTSSKYKVSGTKESGMSELAKSVYDSTLNWSDLDWLKSISNLPIILKGILTPEMALEGVKHGISGIIVSNHGGRQLDGVPATINILSKIAQAVGGKCEVYLDGGVRNGGDVAKAIALGAKTVFVGRPIIWGLACGGQAGAERVLEILRSEFELTMKLLGVRTVSELQRVPNLVIHNSKVISQL